MQSLKLFAQKSKSYHRLSDGTAEGENDACISPNSSAQKEEYDADGELLLAKKLRRARRWSCMHLCGYLFAVLLGLSIGLGLSQLFNLEHQVDGYIKPFGSSHTNVENVYWSENASFAAEPSNETLKAWESIMPVGRGFIKNSKVAKDGGIKAIAVFHQIHCLHGLRTAFYKNTYQLAKLQHQQALSRSLPDTGAPHANAELFSEHHAAHDHYKTSPAPFTPNPFLESLLSAEHQHDPTHATHCFEYIRQALMCAADTNLEDTHHVVNEDGKEIDGTYAWDTARVCRNYDAVMEWAEKHRMIDSGGIV